jgi:DNA-binding MurR/RpiR family transcriptional regulator
VAVIAASALAAAGVRAEDDLAALAGLAAESAQAQGMRVVALTGATGGGLAPLADRAVRVPSAVTAHIQECHLAIEQLLALLAERAIHPTAG